MKRGTCPKCNGRSVFRKTGNRLQTDKVTLKSGVFDSRAAPDRYICASCGYVEYYLSSEQDLQVVRETWEPVVQERAQE